jgi:hypothetical protein
MTGRRMLLLVIQLVATHSPRGVPARGQAHPQGRLVELINRVAGRRLYGWDVRLALAVIEP